MPEKVSCPHCGRNMSPYKVPLTVGFLKGLVKFRGAVALKGENKVHLLHDMQGTAFELTPHEWNNFSRLRFHGLVAKYKEDGQHIAGLWLLTKRGAQFLNGTIKIPESVMIFNNRIIDRSQVLVSLSEVFRNSELPYFESIDDIEYGESDY